MPGFLSTLSAIFEYFWQYRPPPKNHLVKYKHRIRLRRCWEDRIATHNILMPISRLEECMQAAKIPFERQELEKFVGEHKIKYQGRREAKYLDFPQTEQLAFECVQARADRKLRALFAQFDKDGSGTIEPDELKDVLKEMGLPISDETIDTLMEQADADRSGTIEYDEFATVFRPIFWQMM